MGVCSKIDILTLIKYIYGRDMLRIIQALQAKNLATERHFARMFQALVGVRMMDQAKAIAEKHPAVLKEPLPTLREAPKCS
jgi:hypothetical protein